MRKLEYFNRVYDSDFLARMESRGNQRGVACFLTHSSQELAREELDKYLELAFRHGVLDETLKNRLRASEWRPFYQVLAELKTAYFLEIVLKQEIEFYPVGREMKIGDMAILTHQPSVFVEVKAPWEAPWISGARSFDNQRRIRQQLKAAFKQISGDRPSLVVIAGWFNVSPTLKNIGGMEKTLYGRSVIMVPIGATDANIGRGRVRDGFFQPYQNRRLSAVALLEDRLPTKAEYQFQVYHNPHTHMRINSRVFGGHEQFTFDHERREIGRLDM